MSGINFVFACELEAGDVILSGQDFKVQQVMASTPDPIRLSRDVTVDNVVEVDADTVRVNLTKFSSHLLIDRARVVRCA